jgi:SRSO17 transposase
MLPACRMAGDEFAIPTFELTPRDVAGFTDALQEVQGLLHACFPRSEPRAHCFDSLVGQWSALARKSIEPMALRVPGGSGRGLQRFLSAVPWDEEHRRWLSHPLVAAELGAPDGVLLVDETGFVKKGTDSGGVGRQYCGTRGQVAHGQVGGGRAMPHAKAMRSWRSACACQRPG